MPSRRPGSGGRVAWSCHDAERGRQRGFVVKKSPFSAWGRHVDDELVGVVPVVVSFGCVVPIEADVGEVWGSATPRQLLMNKAGMQAFGQARFSPEESVHVWEMPGLRFDTLHGSVVVVDRYNDTEFAFLRSKEGRRALRVNTPLRNVAALIHWAGQTRYEEEYPELLVAALGWRETQPLTRASLRHHVAFTSDTPGDSSIEWGGGPRPPTRLASARHEGSLAASIARKSAMRPYSPGRALGRAASAETEGVDVHAGIADLEMYLEGLD